MNRRGFLALLAGSALAGIPTKAVAPASSLPYTLPTKTNWEELGSMMAQYVRERTKREGFMQQFVKLSDVDPTKPLPRIKVRSENVGAVVYSSEVQQEAYDKAQKVIALDRRVSEIAHSIRNGVFDNVVIVCDASNNDQADIDHGALNVDVVLHGDMARWARDQIRYFDGTLTEEAMRHMKASDDET